jgi:hypothetical protein
MELRYKTQYIQRNMRQDQEIRNPREVSGVQITRYFFGYYSTFINGNPEKKIKKD